MYTSTFMYIYAYVWLPTRYAYILITQINNYTDAPSCQEVKDAMSTIEKFTILMYDRTLCHINLSETRRQLFTQKWRAQVCCSSGGHHLATKKTCMVLTSRYECSSRSKLMYLTSMTRKLIFYTKITLTCQMVLNIGEILFCHMYIGEGQK